MREESRLREMHSPFKAVRISENVYWVGAIDWSLRDFHGYGTERGSTYNAYLIMADKVTLIDAVKKPFLGELLDRISSVIDPKEIDFIISNHSEMDHSGAIPELIDIIKPEKMFASTRGVQTLKEHFHIDYPITPVKDGEKLSLGNMEISFVETTMIHWPDSMFTYFPKDEILFSNDGFGMHLASSQRFADEIEPGILNHEFKKYFANILLPYSNLILKLLERVGKMNLPIKMIATSHGPIWRKDIKLVLGQYEKWSRKEASLKSVIVYDTMWKSTEKMALAIGDGIASTGANYILLPLSASSRSEVVTEILDASAIIVGSSTLNANMLPAVADVLTYLRGLKPQGLAGAAFGSYGWNGVAVGQINQILKDMKVDLVSEGINVKYVPDEKALIHCFKLGKQIGERLLQLYKRSSL